MKWRAGKTSASLSAIRPLPERNGGPPRPPLYALNPEFPDPSPEAEKMAPSYHQPSQQRNATARRGSLIAEPAFQREIESLHRLGPRLTGELIAELAHRHGPEVLTTMAGFAALDPDTLAALDALIWPPLPLHMVRAAA